MPYVGIKNEGRTPSCVERAARVFEEYGDFIRSVIRFNVKDEALSEDLFQDLFLCLISKPLPQEVRNMRGFLYRVVSDKIKDAFRRIDSYRARVDKYAEQQKDFADHYPHNDLVEEEEMDRMFDLRSAPLNIFLRSL